MEQRTEAKECCEAGQIDAFGDCFVFLLFICHDNLRQTLVVAYYAYAVGMTSKRLAIAFVLSQEHFCFAATRQDVVY
jgi:hypothetical protein